MSDFLDNLKEAVGENPLSAALIGGGALWQARAHIRTNDRKNEVRFQRRKR